ncbi:MAG: cupin domain-containing protein [Pseudomonadota bacterium]
MYTPTKTAIQRPDEKPHAMMFSLKAPYMEQGRVTQLVAKTPNLRIHTKVNAEGGENEIHTHLDEDHSFVVLEGQMSVFDEQGNEMVVMPHQGVLLPKGAFYRYLNTGQGNLVVLRIGTGFADTPEGGAAKRVSTAGHEIREGTAENKWLEPIEVPGKFFANEAG